MKVFYLGTLLNNLEKSFRVIFFQWISTLQEQSVLYIFFFPLSMRALKKKGIKKSVLVKYLINLNINMTFILAIDKNKKLHEQISSSCKNGKWEFCIPLI